MQSVARAAAVAAAVRSAADTCYATLAVQHPATFCSAYGSWQLLIDSHIQQLCVLDGVHDCQLAYAGAFDTL
jgi:hypothetical protein